MMWKLPRMYFEDGQWGWIATCECGETVGGSGPAGVLAAMTKHEREAHPEPDVTES